MRIEIGDTEDGTEGRIEVVNIIDNGTTLVLEDVATGEIFYRDRRKFTPYNPAEHIWHGGWEDIH